MSLPPQKFRELVLQLLYALDLESEFEEKFTIKLLMEKFAVSKKNVKSALERAKQVFENRESLDEEINSAAIGYSIERIYKVERNILRLATYELIELEEIPPKVSLSEAVRLCRKYASRSGASFVNGVLDSIYQKIGGEEGEESSAKGKGDES